MGLRGSNSLQKKLKDIRDDYRENVDEAVDDSLDQAERSMRMEIVANDAVDKGELLNSFKHSKTQLVGGTRHTLRNVAPHALYVEFGTGDMFGTSGYPVPVGVRRFGAPTLDTELVNEIENWMRFRPVMPMTGSIKTSAFLIAERIAGQTSKPSGTHPRPYVRPAWGRVKRTVLPLNLKRALRKTVR